MCEELNRFEGHWAPLDNIAEALANPLWLVNITVEDHSSQQSFQNIPIEGQIAIGHRLQVEPFHHSFAGMLGKLIETYFIL